MGRRKLAIGEHGEINFVKLDRDRKGDGVARCRVRCLDGQLRQVEAYGPSKAAATQSVVERANRISGDHATSIGPATLLNDAVNAWLDERRDDESLRDASLRLYASSANAIASGPGTLPLRDCTPGRIQRWLRDTATISPANAKRHRVVLAGAFGLAARHGALEGRATPLDGLTLNRAPRNPVRAATLADVAELRQRARNWVAGTDRPAGGTPRSANTVWIVDILAATGARIGEVLALRNQDVDLDASPARITIAGTLVPDGGKWKRQGVTKTASGWRVVAVPDWCRRSLEVAKAANGGGPDDLLLRAANGAPLSPANVRRRWRALRGDDLDWCTPKSLRKAVATALAEQYGPDAAAHQLGHSSATISRQYYIQRATETPDYTSTLDGFGKQTAG